MPLMPKFRDPFTLKPDEISLERWLLSNDLAEQRLAEEALAEMGPEDALHVLERILIDEGKRRKKGGRVVGVSVLAGIFGTAITLDMTLGTHFSTGIGGAFGGTINLFVNGLSPSELMYRVWERIARSSDLRILPLLLNGWNGYDKRAVTLARPALLRLLPRLSEADGDLLNEAQWMMVGGMTTVRTKPKHAEKRASEMELARAAVHALGKARPKRARNYLLSLAYAENNTGRDDERQLQQIARNYLTVWDAPVIAPDTDLEAEARRRMEATISAPPTTTTAAREWLASAQAEQQRQRVGGGNG